MVLALMIVAAATAWIMTGYFIHQEGDREGLFRGQGEGYGIGQGLYYCLGPLSYLILQADRRNNRAA